MRRDARLLLLALLALLATACQPTVTVPDLGPAPTVATWPEWVSRLPLAGTPTGGHDCSDDGSVLLALTDQGAELIRNEDGSLQAVSVLQTDPPLLAAALSSDGGWVAIANALSLSLYSTQDGSLLSMVRFLQPAAAARLCVSADGQSVAVLRNGWLHLYHGPRLSLRWSSQLAESQSDAQLVMSDNGLSLAVCGATIAVYAPDGATPLWQHQPGGQTRSAALSQDGVYLAVELQDSDGANQLLVYERWAAEPAWRYGIGGAAESLSFSPDGAWLALTAGQFYLFHCSLSRPVIQSQQSGQAAFANGQVLLVEQHSLYRFSTGAQGLVAFQLPEQLIAPCYYVYSQAEWLFALSPQGAVHLVRLPPLPASQLTLQAPIV